MGIFLGTFLENARNDRIDILASSSEVSLLDSQLIGLVDQSFVVDCDILQKRIIKFADKIFLEAQLLEKYDDSSQLTDILKVTHRKYDLLRLMLWTNTVKFKEKCNNDLHTIVYFYKYVEPDIKTRSEQIAFSRYLEDLKEKYGNKFILIPIAGDLNLSSIDLVKESYNIKKYPSIIVDENIIIDYLEDLGRIETEMFASRV
jgi:hypothetical protein